MIIVVSIITKEMYIFWLFIVLYMGMIRPTPIIIKLTIMVIIREARLKWTFSLRIIVVGFINFIFYSSVFTCIFPKVFCSSRTRHSSQCTFICEYRKKVPLIRHHKRYFLFSNKIKQLYLHSSTFPLRLYWSAFCLNFSNSSLNYSAMGFRAIKRTNLIPSVGLFSTWTPAFLIVSFRLCSFPHMLQLFAFHRNR